MVERINGIKLNLEAMSAEEQQRVLAHIEARISQAERDRSIIMGYLAMHDGTNEPFLWGVDDEQ